MKILGIEKITLIDYPGKIASIVFLAGCNFRCQFCYNSELVLPELIRKQPKISEKKFFDFLKTRQGLLDGVVLTGGEPIIHQDLPKFIKKIKDLGFLVKLDTNGSNPEMLKKLIKERLIDYVAMDIKAPIGAKTQNSKLKTQNYNLKVKNKYEQVVGVKIDLEDIKKSIKILKKGEVDFEFRTTVVPTIHQEEDFLSIAKWIGGKNVKYYLQNFKAEKTIDKKFENIKPFEDNFIREIIKKISPYFKICQLR